MDFPEVRNLEGKVAIVTGGASGIGRAVTRAFVKRGARVVAVDIREEAGDALAAELGEAVAFVLGDVSDPATAERAVETAVERFGKLDALVNNAQAARQAPFRELTQEMWDLALDTGFNATRYFMLAAYEELKKTQGAVVNYGSGAAIEGQPTQAAYVASKEAIRGISRVVANEWAADGIRVNVICPLALTEGVRKWSEAAPELYQSVASNIPLGRFGDPETDVAPVVAFLCSDDARYVTGQTVMADGGRHKLY